MAKRFGAGMALRPKVDEAKARALEERAEARGTGAPLSPSPAAQTSKRPDVQTSSRRGIVERKGRITADGRKGAGERRRMTVYLPPELARRLEVHAASEGEQFSDVIADAVRAYLESR